MDTYDEPIVNNNQASNNKKKSVSKSKKKIQNYKPGSDQPTLFGFKKK